MNYYRFRIVVVAAVVAMAAVVAQALINPRFTPVQLVKQSSLVVSVDVKQGASKDQYEAVVREVIKGKAEVKAFSIDLSKARDEQSAGAFRELAAEGKPALFFVGEFEGIEGAGGGLPEKRGLLHMRGKWASCVGGDKGLWLYDTIDNASQAVWAGGTDMLRRAVDYILTDEDPALPVSDGVSWSADPLQIGTLDGAIRAVRPVDLAGDGKWLLFVARDGGDRLLACDAGRRKFTDVTADRGLQSKSQVFAWGNFDGQGKLDLISFDGKALTLHAQQADGKFRATPLDAPGLAESGCVGLAALDGGVKGRSSLLVTAAESLPFLISLADDGKAAVTKLTPPADGAADVKKLGKPGACLVADFDGDAMPDILAPRAAGSMLFRGQTPGVFAPGVPCAVTNGPAETRSALGDFDGDGRLDILSVNAAGVFLWDNKGEGKFVESVGHSGELVYIGQAGGIDCVTGDVNNDGRQDALIAYGHIAPHIFFNRGFRCFGHAHTLDLAANHLLTAAEQGQQSACLGDFDGDGAQDMVLALKNGEIWIFFRANGARDALMAVAALPLGGATQGPVTVSGWTGTRAMGAWNLVPGSSQASFGLASEGPVTLKWRLPGGKEQQKEVIVENGAVRVEIR